MKLSIIVSVDFTGVQTNIASRQHHGVMPGIQLATDLGNRCLQMATATFRHTKQTGLRLLVVGTGLFSGGKNCNVFGRTHDQIISGFQLATDDGDIASAVETDGAVFILRRVDREVAPRFDYRATFSLS